MSEDEREPVGSIGEEALKLLAAVQGWSREHAGQYAGAASAVNEHIATGGRDCRYCPLCQVISAVRETSPEVREHLADAAGSLLQAVAGVLATRARPDHPGADHPGADHPRPDHPRPDHPRADHPGAARSETGLEKIDVTDDEDWEDD